MCSIHTIERTGDNALPCHEPMTHTHTHTHTIPCLEPIIASWAVCVCGGGSMCHVRGLQGGNVPCVRSCEPETYTGIIYIYIYTYICMYTHTHTHTHTHTYVYISHYPPLGIVL